MQFEVSYIRPEAKWSNYEQADYIRAIYEGRTCECCKILGWLVVRGDKPIKLGDSWFSAKYI